MDQPGWDFPAACDVLEQILLRLPPSARRRLRLVCRLWREVVDERTPEKRSRPALLFQTGKRSACVLEGDMSSRPRARCRDLWAGGRGGTFGERYKGMSIVGTRNGLLCLCDDAEAGGAITLANPATGETLPLPLLPCSDQLIRRTRYYWGSWSTVTSKHQAYSFAYHATTGRYQVVHVPCYMDRNGRFDAVQVFTLGDTSWRDVSVPHATTCSLDAGVVSVGGVAYWVTNDEKIASLDLEEEEEGGRFAPVKPPPGLALAGPKCHLTELRGALGVAVSNGSPALEKIEVWVLEGSGREERSWSRRYNVEVHVARGLRQQLTRPRFVYGDYVLTRASENRRWVLCGNKVSGGGGGGGRRKRKQLQCGVVRISGKKRGAVIGPSGGHGGVFAYVETTEPLSVYRASDCRWIYRP